MSDSSETIKDAEELVDVSLNSVREILQSLRFGSVLLTVHDGRIVQIDVTEKRRLKTS